MPTQLRNLKLNRVDIVDDPANQHARILLLKRAEAAHVVPPWLDEQEKSRSVAAAELSSGDRNALPDSAFAAVWTDGDGKKQRALPYKRADGSLDLPHLRNALGRLSQTSMPSSVRGTARSKLEAAASKAGIGDRGDKSMSKSLFRKLSTIFQKFADAEADAGGGPSFADWAQQEQTEPEHEEKDADAEAARQGLATMKAHHEEMGKALAAYGDTSGLPPAHPAHALKAAHKALGDAIVQHEARLKDAEAAKAGAHKDAEAMGHENAFKEAEAALSTLGDGKGGIPNQEQLGSIHKALKTVVEKQRESFEKRIEAAEARAKAAESIAKSEADARAVEQEKTTLRKFRHVQVDIEKDAALFNELKKSNKPLYDAMVAKLDAAEAAAKAGRALEQELGSSHEAGGGNGSAWAEIEAGAMKLVEKDANLTKAKAIEKFMKTDEGKKLVKRYYAEDLRREERASA